MAQEIELKLAFPAAARATVLAHPLLAGAERLGEPRTLINTYYDTPQLELSARRVALRTRKIGEQWLQTVKCAAESFGGLSSRPEWEQPFPGEFDFSGVSEAAPRALLEDCRTRIVPLFTTNFERHSFALSPRPGVRILIMLDSGLVEAGGRQECISELELELAAGEASDLLELARRLAAELPLLPYDPSKAARGYRLFRNEALRAAHFKPQTATAGESAHALFLRNAWAALAAWGANHHGLIEGADDDNLHQLRNTLRALRGLLALFAPALPEDFTALWRTRLAELAATLAPARDLEAQAAELALLHRKLPRLRECLLLQREAALTHLRTELGAAGAGLALLDFTAALHTLPASTASAHALGHQALATARHGASKAHRRAGHGKQSAAQHSLRLRLKRLLLAQRVFAPEIATAKLERLIRRLGRAHDLAGLAAQLECARKRHPALRAELKRLAPRLAATRLQLRHRIVRRCTKLLRPAG